MASVRFDIAEPLHLYFRIARAGSKVFTFVDDAEADYDVSGITWELNIFPKDSTTPVIALTDGNGLTVATNTITVNIDEEDSAIPERLYHWELYDDTNKQTWLFGNAYFTSKEPADAGDSATITVNTNPDTVLITVSNSAVITSIDGGIL